MKSRNVNINFNAEPQDHERLETVQARLELTRSEICRRALRLALDRLERTKLPGAYHKADTSVVKIGE